jgi:hypothetical protein
MTTSRPRIAAAALIGACVLLCAGGARAESVFGLNLVGERFDAGDARAHALGGFVQLLDDSLGVLQYNPATAAWAKRVTFGVAGYVTANTNRTVDVEEKTVATKISGIAVAFPLFRRTLSATFGYRGRYDPDGEFSVPQMTSAGDPYTDRFERSGGLWTVPFGLAVDLGRYAKLGGFYSLERGSIENRWIIDFEGASTADAVSVQNREFEAGGWGAGAVLRPVDRVWLGVGYEGAIDYDVAVAETYTNASANATYRETMHLPERWTASATVRAGGGFTAYAGGSVSDFADFRGLAFPEARLVREQTAALGVEFARLSLPIRACARYEQLPYTTPEGEKIRRTAFGLGTGLLFRSGKGKLDVALQFGRTGSLDSNGYEDRFVRFSVSIVGSEEWTRKREGRY